MPGRAAVAASIETALGRADDLAVVAEAVRRACTMRTPPSVAGAGREARTSRRSSAVLPRRMFETAFRKEFGLAP